MKNNSCSSILSPNTSYRKASNGAKQHRNFVLGHVCSRPREADNPGLQGQDLGIGSGRQWSFLPLDKVLLGLSECVKASSAKRLAL